MLWSVKPQFMVKSLSCPYAPRYTPPTVTTDHSDQRSLRSSPAHSGSHNLGASLSLKVSRTRVAGSACQHPANALQEHCVHRGVTIRVQRHGPVPSAYGVAMPSQGGPGVEWLQPTQRTLRSSDSLRREAKKAKSHGKFQRR